MSTINLLPKDYLSRRLRQRTTVLCLALFGAVTLGVVGAYVASERSYQHTRDIRDEVEASYSSAARLIEQMQHLKAQKAKLLRKAEQTAALQERVPRSYVLGVITNACPRYVSLAGVNLRFKRTVTGRSKGKQATAKYSAAARRRSSAPPDCVLEIVVTGLASTDVEVAKFIANLARNPLLTTVDLVYSQEKLLGEKKKMRVREFQVRLELKQDADVLDVLSSAGKAARPPGGLKGLVKGILGVKP